MMTLQRAGALGVLLGGVALGVVSGPGATAAGGGAKAVDDLPVITWIEEKTFGTDGARATATNPADAKREEWVNAFACADGQLLVSEFPNDAGAHPRVRFVADKKVAGGKYLYYSDPMAGVEKFKGAFEHGLAYATYNVVFVRSLGLLGAANMNAEQAAGETAARQMMIAKAALADVGVKDGTFHPEAMKELMGMLKEYKATAGDPAKDGAKAAAAIKVLRSGCGYLQLVTAEKEAAIREYMEAVGKILSEEQKKAFAEAAEKRIEQAREATQPGK